MAEHEPRVVIEAHLLRRQAALEALAHGTTAVRPPRAIPRLVLYSLVFALIIAAGVVAAHHIIDLVVAGKR